MGKNIIADLFRFTYSSVIQLAEIRADISKVTGSSPVATTIRAGSKIGNALPLQGSDCGFDSHPVHHTRLFQLMVNLEWFYTFILRGKSSPFKGENPAFDSGDKARYILKMDR